jgi:hypothetical protein
MLLVDDLSRNISADPRGYEMRFVHTMLVLVLCVAVAPTLGHTKERSSGKGLAVKKQARLSSLDDEGYRLVSTNSTLKCRETLRGTLECR